MKDSRQLSAEAVELSKQIGALLAGKGPDVQGAALAAVAATYFAGHHPKIREDVMTLWMISMLKMIKPSEDEISEGKRRDTN